MSAFGYEITVVGYISLRLAGTTVKYVNTGY